MKCPKCHYLSFDPEPRCRNCGYTLALDPDLVMHPETNDEGPFVDLSLRGDVTAAPEIDIDLDRHDRPARSGRPARRTGTSSTPPPQMPAPTPPAARLSTPGPFDIAPADDEVQDGGADVSDGDMSASTDAAGVDAAPSEVPPSVPVPERRPSETRARRAPAPPPPTAELPLFVKGLSPATEPAADESEPVPASASAAEPSALPPPIVEAPVAPRPPLSVRRSATEPSASPRIGPLDRDLLEGLERIAHDEQREAAERARRDHLAHNAAPMQRLASTAIDGMLLGAIAGGVVAATLRWIDRGWSEWATVPLVPLAAFVLLIVAGYLFLFTAAGGQTAGKMMMGIRVVDGGEAGTAHEPLSVRQALARSLLAIPSVLLLGAGLVPALTGERRALHDRLSRTRVVRA